MVDARSGRKGSVHEYPVPKIMWSTFSKMLPLEKCTVRSPVSRFETILVIGGRSWMLGCWKAKLKKYFAEIRLCCMKREILSLLGGIFLSSLKSEEFQQNQRESKIYLLQKYWLQ